MTVIAAALGPVFGLILLGALLRRVGVPGEGFWPGIARLTYVVLFPALLVHKLALADLGSTPLGPVLAALGAVVLAASVVLFALRRVVATSGPSFTSVFQGGIRINTYIGLACAQALYGAPGLAVAAIVVAVLIPVVNVLCVACFDLTTGEEPARPGTVAAGLARNPLIVACVVGIALGTTGVGLPGWTDPILDLLGSAALPLGLLAVGAAMTLRLRPGALREIAAASAVKLILLPGLMLGVLALTPLDAPAGGILLLFATLPTASSAYILARELGGDTELMANMITVQTLLAFVAIPAWLAIGTAAG